MRGVLGASLVVLCVQTACGSQDEAAPTMCSSGCGGGDARAEASAGGTTGGRGGNAGSGGGADASAGAGGTAGSAGSDAGAGAGGSAGTAGASGGSGGAADSGPDASGGSGGTAGSGGPDAAFDGTAGSSGDASAGSSGTGGADAGPDTTGDASGCVACSAYSQPVSAGNLAAGGLTELSGIAASRRQPNVFFAHNDSGDSARFFAFDQGGRSLAEFRLQGASATDWEDMTLGPCPAGSCLFFGDIGDNSQTRARISILRVTEPDVTAVSDAGPTAIAHERFDYVYAPGPQNAEALLADPATGNLYIVTKSQTGTSLVFRIDAPASPGAVQTLQTLTTLSVPRPGSPLVTGGAVHPCGDRLLLRTYGGLFEYVAPPGQPLEAAFAVTARSVPAAVESQGEAVTYLGDGLGYVTASEGTAPALYLARCQ